MNEKESVFKVFGTAATILYTLHIYLSYRWLYKLLEKVDLHTSSMISIEDITLTFGDLNQTLVIMSSNGFVIIIIAQLLLKNNTYNNINTIIINGYKEFEKENIKFYRKLKKRWKKIVFMVLIFGTIIGFFTFLIYQSIEVLRIQEHKDWMLCWLLIFIVLPTIYIFYVPKRNVIALVSILIFLRFSNLLIDKVVTEPQSKTPENFIALSFKYKENQAVKTDRDTLWVYYEGYKYLILRDPKTNKAYPFERAFISNIERKKEAFKREKSASTP